MDPLDALARQCPHGQWPEDCPSCAMDLLGLCRHGIQIEDCGECAVLAPQGTPPPLCEHGLDADDCGQCAVLGAAPLAGSQADQLVPLPSGRGTSLAAAAAASPRSRVGGRRLPEAAYRRPKLPEPKSKAKAKSRKLRDAEARHRATYKRRLVDRRSQHEDVLVPAGEPDAFLGQQPAAAAPLAAGEVAPEAPEPGATAARPAAAAVAPDSVDDGGPHYGRIPYTGRRSPGRDRRGKRVHLAFSRKASWVSAAELARMGAAELGAILVAHKYVSDRKGQLGP